MPAPRYAELQRPLPQVYELGGDYFDFVPLPNDRLTLAVGYASGKDLAADGRDGGGDQSPRLATAPPAGRIQISAGDVGVAGLHLSRFACPC
jgi:hypothetical protein